MPVGLLNSLHHHSVSPTAFTQCAIGEDCVIKSEGGKWLLGCPKDGDVGKNSLHSFDEGECPSSKGECKCIPHVHVSKEDPIQAAVPGEGDQFAVTLKYRMPKNLDEISEDIKTKGFVLQRLERDFLPKEQWCSEWPTTHLKVGQVVGALHAKVKNAESAASKLLKMTQTEKPLGDDQTEKVVADMETCLTFGQQFEKFQNVCTNFNRVAAKLDCAGAKDSAPDCMTSPEATKDLTNMWQKISSASEMLRGLDEWTIAAVAASQEAAASLRGSGGCGAAALSVARFHSCPSRNRQLRRETGSGDVRRRQAGEFFVPVC